MAIQMILCMETNKKAATDYIYIKETINRFYETNNQTKFSLIYMNSKSRYNSKYVLKTIKQFEKEYINGETKVIYCIDTDAFENNVNHARELSEISRFCEMNQYDLVWFCHNIEEVYLGKRISDKQKVIEAGNFRKKNKISEIPRDILYSDVKRIHVSNILRVFDKYLKIKK